MAVRRQRAPGVDYSRATIEDRPEGVDNIKVLDADGAVVDVGASTPLPTDTSDFDKLNIENIKDDLDVIKKSLQLLLIYAEEAMELGLEIDNADH